MFFLRLFVPLSLALGAIAVPLDTSEVQEQLPDGLNLCIEEKNCEVYKLDDGAWSFRYIPGMEPGTDWYNEHANTTDEIGPQPDDVLDKRHSPCDSSNGRTCSSIWVRPDRTLYGTLWPRTAIQVLGHNCYEFGCNVGQISQSTSWSTGGGPGTIPDQLRITPNGVFDPSIRWHLIVAIQDVLRDMTTSHRVISGHTHHTPPWSATMHQAPYRIHVARFRNQAMQGDLSVNISMRGAGAWGCAQVLQYLGTAIGYLNPMLGGALGQLSAFCA